MLPRGPGQVDYRKTDRELCEDISVREMILLHLGSCNPQEIDWSTVDTWDDANASGFHMHSCDSNLPGLL